MTYITRFESWKAWFPIPLRIPRTITAGQRRRCLFVFKRLKRRDAAVIVMGSLTIVLISMFAGSSGAGAQGLRVALVIGNSNYEIAGGLTNPRNDAEDLAEKLATLGFDVIKGVDLTKGDMDRLIRQFSERLDNADLGLFFYAGHGIQVDGTNYLVPTDAKARSSAALDFEMVRTDLIQATMERGARANIIILDACRNNPLARTLASTSTTRSLVIGEGLAEVKAGKGTLVSFSTQPGKVALDSDGGRNSPYAAALLRHLGRPGEDIVNALIRVRKEVLQTTNGRQIPWDQHSLLEQIVLAGGAARPAGAASAQTERDGGVSKDDMKQLLDEIRRQRPKESAPAPATKPSNNRDVSDDEAKWARVWASIERSTSEAVLSQFIVQAAGSIYADLARARLDEVRATAAASTSVRQPAPQSDNSTSASGGPGTWTPSSTCEKLWYQRNAVFYRYKYCFTGDKGRAVFGNAGCSRSQDQAWNAMSDSDRNAVNQIKDLERANAC